MDALIRRYERLLKTVSTDHVRSLYETISWNSRLIGIKGARGVGKTTLMLQRIKIAFPDIKKALYVSLDDIWFAGNTLVALAEKAADAGVTHIFIDEVHRMPGWERQIKNIYDFLPELHIVFTGSSMLEIDNSIADLSRRSLMYELKGLSFREYLGFKGHHFPKISLTDILYNHLHKVKEITEKVQILPLFNKYLQCGYYPFFTTESKDDYLIKVNSIITAVIDFDIPAIERIEYATQLKIKHLLAIFASQTPSPLNIKSTAELVDTTANQLIKMLSLLQRAQIIRLLYYKTGRNPKSMSKPQKVLFDNPSIINSLGFADKGKLRETFIASMLASAHEVAYSLKGDFQVDNRYIIEVGGSNKGFSQIKDIPDSFVAADDILIGFGNKIPLWLFGFLY